MIPHKLYKEPQHSTQPIFHQTHGHGHGAPAKMETKVFSAHCWMRRRELREGGHGDDEERGGGGSCYQDEGDGGRGCSNNQPFCWGWQDASIASLYCWRLL